MSAAARRLVARSAGRDEAAALRSGAPLPANQGQGQEGQIPLPEKLIFLWGGVNMCFQEMRDVVVVLGM